MKRPLIVRFERFGNTALVIENRSPEDVVGLEVDTLEELPHGPWPVHGRSWPTHLTLVPASSTERIPLIVVNESAYEMTVTLSWISPSGQNNTVEQHVRLI